MQTVLFVFLSGLGSWMWNSIVSVLDHCRFIYFARVVFQGSLILSFHWLHRGPIIYPLWNSDYPLLKGYLNIWKETKIAPSVCNANTYFIQFKGIIAKTNSYQRRDGTRASKRHIRINEWLSLFVSRLTVLSLLCHIKSQIVPFCSILIRFRCTWKYPVGCTSYLSG